MNIWSQLTTEHPTIATIAKDEQNNSTRRKNRAVKKKKFTNHLNK